MRRLLIVSADYTVLDRLDPGLEAHGHAVTATTTAEHAFELAVAQTFDCLVVDICLAGQGAARLLNNLRGAGRALPALVLGVDAGHSSVAGLPDDADCLAKPFKLAEVAARLRALLRRRPREGTPVLQAGDLRVDGLHRRAFLDGVEIRLTCRECELLQCLLRHKNRAVTRQMIDSEVWKEPGGTLTNIIEVYINALRRKLGGVGRRSLIQTVRGVGYKFQEHT
jgi:DNA-binding response OmpR family regulator